MKKIYILVGDPNNDTVNKSLCTALSEQYMKGAKEAGHEVRYTHIGNIKFDPVLHKGYRVIQTLEPDLVQVQEDMKWADHIVLLHPVWWASLPAIFKGLFDRIWVPGFAFYFWKTGMMKGLGWTKMLRGKSARIIQTSGTMPFIVSALFGDPSKILKVGILGFAGISPILVTKFGPVAKAKPATVDKWMKKTYQLGKKGK